tara:strand:- start:153 stop:1154 length:1002 start_codon:yes stop_codon:yes gene_type:complete
MKHNPNIVITVGDEAGVGPEIILKALASKEIPKKINILIVGNKTNLISKYFHLKSLGIEQIVDPNQLEIEDLKISNTNVKEPSNDTGNASFLYLKHAIEIVKKSSNSALVTSPICKKLWHSAGHKYSGQTELLSEICNSPNVGMLFTAKSPFTGWRFNTLLATTHIPIKEVSHKLNKNLINLKLDLLYGFCNKFKENPTLHVAGFNPHAGEEGVLGTEEVDFINQAIHLWKIENPLVNSVELKSPDSCWISSAKAWRENKINPPDGILALYHDQGLIPVKIITLNYSVNTTIGLPIIRTSPDHGTGFDIANRGIAQCQSMIEAIKTAYDLLIN